MKMKGFLEITSKAIGVLLTIIGSDLFAVVLLEFVICVIYGYLEFLNWFSAIVWLLIPVLLISLGLVLYRLPRFFSDKENRELKKWEAEKARKEKAINEAQQVEIVDSVDINKLHEKKAKEERKKREKAVYFARRIDRPCVSGYQTIKVHHCQKGGFWYRMCFTTCVSIAVLSIIVAIVMATRLEQKELLIMTAILTCTGWGGYIGALCAYHVNKYMDACPWITTNGKMLYMTYLEFEKDRGRKPVTTIGQIIYSFKVIQARDEVYQEKKKYVKSDEFTKMIECKINGEGKFQENLRLVKFNYPRIVGKRLWGVKIKYWDAEKRCWESRTLTKRNEGYEEICEMIRERMKTYDYSIFK